VKKKGSMRDRPNQMAVKAHQWQVVMPIGMASTFADDDR